MATKVAFEGKRELRWLTIDKCLVTYMEAEVEFGEDVWDQWLEALGRPSMSSLMLCSWGPTKPTHAQWRRATRLMREHKLSVVVVTDARHNLALAKAASWLGTDIQSHRWSEIDAGIEKAGLAHQRIAAKAMIIALRDRFGAVMPREGAAEPELHRPPSSILFESDYGASSAMVM